MRWYLVSTLFLSVPLIALSPATGVAQNVDDEGGRLWSDEAVDDSYRNDESESWYESRYTRGYYGAPYYRGPYYGGPYYGRAYYRGAYPRGPYDAADYGNLYGESQDLEDYYANRDDLVFDFEDNDVDYEVAGPSYHDDVGDRYHGWVRDNERDDALYVPRERLIRLQGEVIGKRLSTFRNRDGQYVVVRLRTGDGQTAIVNLGRHNELRQLGLELGDRISVFGRRAMIDGQPALIARHIQADDRLIRVGQTEQRPLR